MAIRTISEGNHLRLTFSVPKRHRIQFNVDADYPVTTYILDDDGLGEFHAGYEIPSYGGFVNRKHHKQDLYLLFSGHWHLIIMNKEPHPVKANFEVYL